MMYTFKCLQVMYLEECTKREMANPLFKQWQKVYEVMLDAVLRLLLPSNISQQIQCRHSTWLESDVSKEQYM